MSTIYFNGQPRARAFSAFEFLVVFCQAFPGNKRQGQTALTKGKKTPYKKVRIGHDVT